MFQWQTKKANKYHAQKTVACGIKFDSRREAGRYLDLCVLEKAGKIKNLRRQVKYVLIPSQRKSDGKIERETSYYADFVYFDCEKQKEVVEDVKGMKMGAAYNVFVIKRKLMLERFGIEVLEV